MVIPFPQASVKMETPLELLASEGFERTKDLSIYWLCVAIHKQKFAAES